MSFANKVESPALNPTTPDRRNTYREAESLPFGNGYMRLAPKWITDRFNDHWSNGKTTGQAYCSVAGVLCHGPIQHIRAIYVGGEGVGVFDVSRPTNPADPDYYYTTIEFGGADADLGVSNRMRFYWGDEAQPVDSWLVSTTGQDHPPYKGQTLVIFERLHCGQVQANSQAQPSLPNIEFTVYRLPSPSMPAGLRFPAALPGGTAQFRGVNIVSGIWDFLTHARGGLGLTSATLDQADWTSNASNIETGAKPAAGLYGEEAYLSPLLTGQQDAGKVVQDALEYIDGWTYTEAGKIRMGWFPNDGTIPSPLPEISEADHVEAPSIRTDSLSESPSTIVVELLEGDSGELDLIDAIETARVPFIREIVGTSPAKKLQRPWITSRDIGARYATRAAGLATIPAKSGESVVRLDAAVRLDGTPLRIGDIFEMNYAPMGELVIARLVERLEDETTATLRWERERGTSSVPYAPASDARDNYALPDPPTPGTGDWAILEAPSGLSEVAAAVILAHRPSDALAGMRAYLDLDDNWATGSTLLGFQSFAAKVTLDATINSSVVTCVLNGTGVDVSPFLGSGFTTVEQDDDTMVLVIGTEWLSIGTISSAGVGSYNAGIKRGRLSSTAAGHTAADVGWLIRRDRLTLWTSTTFTSLSDRFFKVGYYHAKADGTLSASKQVTFENRAPNPPTSFAATSLPGAVKLSWVVPTGINLFGYQIYQHTANTLPGSPSYFVAHAGNTFTATGLTAAVPYYFWIVALTDTIGVSSTVGSVTATPTSASSGTDAYTITQTMPAPQVRCDSAGTPIAGELTTPRVQTTFSVMKGITALTGVTGTPGSGQFRVLANGAAVNSTATFSTAYIELDTVSSDSGYVPYKVELEGTAVFVVGQWHWVKTLAGATGTGGSSVAQVLLYRRSVSSPTLPSTTATYTFATGVLTGHNNSWTQAIPAVDGNPLWVTAASASASTATDTIASGEWAATVKILEDGAAGANGLNVATAWLFQRAASPPAVPASTLTFTFSTGGLSGTLGSWTQAVPGGSNPLYVTTATASATSATDTIATGEWATPQIHAQNGADGSNGTNGTNGAGYVGTSTTSLAIGTGSKSFTTQTGLAYVVGQPARLIYTSDTAQFMEGPITAYNSGTGAMTINSVLYAGSGTYSAWTLAVIGQSGVGAVNGGVYVSGGTYYANTVTTSIVYVGTTPYRAVNPAKNGLTTWGTPGSSSDWVAADASFKFLAAGIALIDNATINKTLIMGDGATADAGIIRSAGATAFGTGAGYWLNPRSSGHSNSSVFRVGDPAGYNLSYDGTNLIVNPYRMIIGDSTGTDDTVGFLQVVGDFSARKFGSGAQNVGLTCTVAQGTIASPSATASGSFAALRLRGYNGSSYSSASAIRLKAATAWTGSTTAAEIEIIVANLAGSGSNYLYYSSEGKLQFGGTTATRDNANLYRGATNTMKCDGTFEAGSFKTAYLEAGVASAVDVKDVNLRVYSGGTQNARIDYTNGYYYVQGTKVLGARATGWTTTPTGTLTRTTFATPTVTLEQLAERVAALINDVHAVGTGTHGIIGS